MAASASSSSSTSSSSSSSSQHQQHHQAGVFQTKSSTPCAACKLLRRRCAEECPFSPYFSPLEPQKFACVHKVFGASNVSKMIMEVPESQRANVVNSLVYEANARLRDPIHGCLGAISTLQQQAQALQAELHAVRTQIMRYKFQESAMAASALAHASQHDTTSTNTITTLTNPPLLSFKLEDGGSESPHISLSIPHTSLSTIDQYRVNSIEANHMNSFDFDKKRYWTHMHQSC